MSRRSVTRPHHWALGRESFKSRLQELRIFCSRRCRDKVGDGRERDGWTWRGFYGSIGLEALGNGGQVLVAFGSCMVRSVGIVSEY